VLTVEANGLLDLTFLGFVSGATATLGAGDQLTVHDGGSQVQLQLAGDYSGGAFETLKVSAMVGGNGRPTLGVVFVPGGGAAVGAVMAAEVGSLGGVKMMAQSAVFGGSGGRDEGAMPVVGGSVAVTHPEIASELGLPQHF
jgi:hypothetical protein